GFGQASMEGNGVLLPQFFGQVVIRLFWLALTGDDAKRPIGNSLLAGIPFVRPGKETRARQSALHHAIDVPAQHFCLLLLRVADGVHAELIKNEGTIFRQILQAQQVTLEVALPVEVNIEAAEVDVLRKQKLGGRKSGVGIERTVIDAASQPDKLLDEIGDATDAEPAHHLRRDFVANEVAEDGGVTSMRFDDRGHRLPDIAARTLLMQELDMLRPR